MGKVRTGSGRAKKPLFGEEYTKAVEKRLSDRPPKEKREREFVRGVRDGGRRIAGAQISAKVLGRGARLGSCGTEHGARGDKSPDETSEG